MYEPPPSPNLVAELSYASVTDYRVNRPFFWLVLAIPIPTMLYDLQQVFWMLLSLIPGSSYGSWSGPFPQAPLMLVVSLVRVTAGALVVFFAASALRTGRVGALPWFCLTFACAVAGYGAMGLLSQFVNLFNRNLGNSPVMARVMISLAIGTIGTCIAPTIAFVLLQRLKREYPDQ